MACCWPIKVNLPDLIGKFSQSLEAFSKGLKVLHMSAHGLRLLFGGAPCTIYRTLINDHDVCRH
jgi:hypothetical protein